MARYLVEIHESYYGVSEARGKDTWLWVKLGPSTKTKPFSRAETKLVIQGLGLPVHGLCVVGTTRRAWVSGGRHLGAPSPPGKPEFAVRLSYDHTADTDGSWMGYLAEVKYPVKLVRCRRKTAWERL